MYLTFYGDIVRGRCRRNGYLLVCKYSRLSFGPKRDICQNSTKRSAVGDDTRTNLKAPGMKEVV